MDIPEPSHGFVIGNASPLLELERITRGFGGTLALDAANLTVRNGTVHAVLGENGAGKTTLLRIAFGMLQPEAGTIRWRGTPVTITSPADAIARGIGMVHQHFTLVSAMTVAENVALGGRGRFSPASAAERVRDVATAAGLALDPNARVDTLSVGAQQRCEIVKALARDVQLLILDEPTAVLSPQEAADLLAWTRRFADAGHAVVLITHKLRDALSIADTVTVLRRGISVYSASAASTSESQLAEAMLGERAPNAVQTELDTEFNTELGAALGATTLTQLHTDAVAPATAGRVAATVVEARDVHARDARGVGLVRGASMTVRAREIVGIAAVEGSGQHELLRMLAQRAVPDRGSVVAPHDTAFIPEDRQHDALLLDAPLFENVALRGASQRTGTMRWRELREETARIMQAHDVRATDSGAMVRSLSGGNQQKLVLGRELAGAPAAVIAENPSRGLDFRATAAVHAALRQAAARGAAIVLYSSDLDEVLALSHRVYAMRDGILYETAGDRDTVGRAMLGSA